MFGSTNLIVHQGIANIFDQSVESLGIIGDVEEIREIGSGYYRVRFLANLFQFPGNPCPQTLFSTLKSAGSLFQHSLSLFLIDITGTDGVEERFRKPFDPGRQRFYGLLIDFRSLERR